MLFLIYYANTIYEKAKGALWPISGAFQSINAQTTHYRSRFSWYIHWGGNGRAANLPCFHHDGEEFDIPTILFYLASDNKNKREEDDHLLLRHMSQYGTSAYLIICVFTHCFVLSIHVTFPKSSFCAQFYAHNRVKISIHVTNFTLIDTHVPFAAISKFYVIIVLYFVVYVTIGNLYYLNTLFMYGFCCTPPLQSHCL